MNRSVQREQLDSRRWLNWVVTLFLVAGTIAVVSSPALAQDTDAAAESLSYVYTVEDGDNWDVVAAKTGVSVEVLQAANPDAVRETGWLLTGEELTIPLPDEGERLEHQVGPGESWSTIADDYGITMAALQAANQKSIRPGMILYNGEKLLIPPPTADDAEEAAEEGEEAEADAEAAPDDAEAEAGDAGDDAAADDAAAEDAAAEDAAAEEEPTGDGVGDEAAAAEEDLADDAGEEEAGEEEAGEAAEEEDAPDAESPAEDAGEDAAEEPGAVVGEDEAAEPAADAATEADAAATEEAEAETEAGEGDAAETDAAEAGSSEEISATAPITETVIDADVPEAEAGEAEASEEAAEGDAVEEGDEAAEEEAALPACPELLADYPDAIVAVLNASEGSAEALTDFLTSCGADIEGGVVTADLTGDGVEDFVVVYQNPSQESTFVESDLIIVSLGEDGYEVAYRARAAGEVRLVATEDINDDTQADVVWTDTTCGASTCFDTVNVRSWDGSVWADWTDGTITMAYADIELGDLLDQGGGQEIELTGGIYGSVGAGPQRSRTETWSSVDGAPYALGEKVYSESECLYHTVLDANRALAEAGTPEELVAAKELYEKAVADESLIKCWVRPAELEELRSFSLYRLAVIEAYEGNLEDARDRVTELAATYADGAIAEAAQTWLETVEEDGALAAACDVVTAFAQENPEVWEILADYGYTNPSFEASDLCPSPDVAGDGTGEEATEDGATGASPRSDPGVEGAGADAGNSGELAGSDAAGGEAEAEADVDVDTISAIAENLPGCPATLVEYADFLPEALNETAGDTEIIERWMYACGGLADDRGAVVTAELNGDGIDDYVVFPTVVSDVGLGPDGAQGAVYILHSDGEGAYSLAESPEIFGEPTPLAIDDLNADGNVDVAWTVEGCSTFCVLETQIVSWDGEEYVSLIEPGATIASGTAAFEDVKAGDPGAGQSLVLSGGVSGTPEGGLTVDHQEVWESVGGAPFQRLSWTYDADAAGGNCLGLRLVEADVALQAADVLGYGPAFEKYAQALEPDLDACSIFGLQPEEELALLQGVANFRLIQVQALDEDLEGAAASLDFFAEQLADSAYVQAAQQWLDEFVASGDAAAACDAMASVLEENPDLWQITDHFGYNHPALAAEQICFVP